MKTFNHKNIFTIIALCFNLCAYSQSDSSHRILGTWTFAKFEFLMDMPDSANMIAKANSSTVCFLANNRFVTTNKKTNVVDSGSYSIKGKYLYQNGNQVEIIRLIDTEFVIKIPNVMRMYFRKP